jgi:histidyl-tRNA synthetase
VLGFKDEESQTEVLKRMESIFNGIPGSEVVIGEMQTLKEHIEAMEISDKVKIDTSLARGLDYYTGMIFEAVISGGEESKLGLGSIAAGGRYDNLIGMHSKNSIPSVGGSLGIERIFNILEQRDQHIIDPLDIVVSTIGKIPSSQILKIASWMWD